MNAAFRFRSRALRQSLLVSFRAFMYVNAVLRESLTWPLRSWELIYGVVMLF